MIELERSTDGFRKMFKASIVQGILASGLAQKARQQSYWKLPEDSMHKLDKDGLMVQKAKKRTPKPKTEDEDGE